MAENRQDELIRYLTDRYLHSETWEENRPLGFARYTSENAPYEALFSPCRVGRQTLKNRLMIAPEGRCPFASESDEALTDFYLHRAESGAGLLCSWPYSVERDADPGRMIRWSPLNKRLRALGAKTLLQLIPDSEKPEKWNESAAAALAGGFDGICLELRGGFSSSVEAVKTLRRRLGNEALLLLRVSISPALAESGLPVPKKPALPSLAGSFEALTELWRAGADAFEVSLGCGETPWLRPPSVYLPAACFSEAARAVHDYFRSKGLPAAVAASGRLGYPDVDELLVRSQSCELISLDGAGLSDPDWCRKAREGRCAEIDPQPLASFTIRSGREKIAVTGGGCSGMQFALKAAADGRQVELFEADAALGGRARFGVSRAAYESENRLARLRALVAGDPSIRVRPATTANPDLLKKGDPDLLVFAQGLRASAPCIPGWGEIPFVSAEELPFVRREGRRIAILGASRAACELAWKLLSEDGARRVFLVTAEEEIMPDAPDEDRAWMLHHLPLRGGRILKRCLPKAVSRGTLLVFDEAKRKRRPLPCDLIVVTPDGPPDDRLLRRCIHERLAPEYDIL